MIKESYIKACSYYLPEHVLTNEMISQKFSDWPVEKISAKVGINQRHIAASNETAGDMAYKAGLRLFEEHKIDPSTIDFILLCTQSPDYFLPTTACILQARLGIPTSAGAMDFNLGCSGYIYGLAIAKGLINASIAKNILLLTAETYTKYIHPEDKGNQTIFGDGASATLISDEGFAKIQNFELGTDGNGASNLIVETGGHRVRTRLGTSIKDKLGALKNSDNLYMNGSEIFSFTQSHVPPLVNTTLSKNQLSMQDIDLFIFHQANQFMLDFLRKKLKIDKDKFFYYMSEVGNTVSSTIPIALYHAKKENLLTGNILLAGFGVGYSWGATIIKIKQ